MSTHLDQVTFPVGLMRQIERFVTGTIGFINVWMCQSSTFDLSLMESTLESINIGLMYQHCTNIDIGLLYQHCINTGLMY